MGTEVLINVVGGVALLLWGIRMVRTGVTRAFGAQLRNALSACTRNRLAAFGGGFAITGVLQSSTATALIVSSFTARALITPLAALAVMLGADIGSSVAAQALSLDLGLVSPLLIVFGVTMFMAASGGRPRHLGRVAVGLGLVLLSLRLIVAASEPLRESTSFAAVMGPLAEDPILALILAALITWLAHSSLAVVLLVVSLAGAGAIGVELAFALVLGANVGSAIAPLALTARVSRVGRRAPLGNMAMRLIGALIALPLIDLAAPLIAAVDAEPARQVVNFHTAFNIALAALFLPLIDLLAAALRRILPEDPASEAEEAAGPRYLDPDALQEPAVALSCATRETLRLGDAVESMLARTIEVYRRDDDRLLREVEDDDNKVDRLYDAIKLYVIGLSREEMDERESRRSVEILNFVTNLEHIGDVIDKNLMDLARKKIRVGLTFSPSGWAEIEAFHKRVIDSLQLALNVFTTGDIKLARQLMEEKVALRAVEQDLSHSHLERLRSGRPDTVQSSGLHLDVVRDLKRINAYVCSVAYPILEAAGELSKSRLVAPERAAPKTEPAERHGGPPSPRRGATV